MAATGWTCLASTWNKRGRINDKKPQMLQGKLPEPSPARREVLLRASRQEPKGLPNKATERTNRPSILKNQSSYTRSGVKTVKKTFGNVVLVSSLMVMAIVLFLAWPRPKAPTRPAAQEKPATIQHSETWLNVECEPHPCASAGTVATATNGSPWVMGTAVTTATQIKTVEPDPISALRAEAHKRGIKWRIICNGDETFHGWAIPPGAKFAGYIEGGAKDDWYDGVDYKSQPEAAAALLRAIQGPPTMKAKNKPPEEKETKHQCPPELSGN